MSAQNRRRVRDRRLEKDAHRVDATLPEQNEKRRRGLILSDPWGKQLHGGEATYKIPEEVGRSKVSLEDVKGGGAEFLPQYQHQYWQRETEEGESICMKSYALTAVALRCGRRIKENRTPIRRGTDRYPGTGPRTQVEIVERNKG